MEYEGDITIVETEPGTDTVIEYDDSTPSTVIDVTVGE